MTQPFAQTLSVHLRNVTLPTEEIQQTALAALEQALPGTQVTVVSVTPQAAPNELASAAQRLLALHTALGLTDDALDDDTHDSGDSHAASQANNDGPSGQIEFLLSNRWTEQDIETKLRDLAG